MTPRSTTTDRAQPSVRKPVAVTQQANLDAPLRAAALLMTALILAGLFAPQAAQSASVRESFPKSASSVKGTFDHSAWDKLLARYVRRAPDGLTRVRYRAWKASAHKGLKAYLHALQSADPAKLGPDEQFAYWINLYNAKTVEVILNNYPVTSIRNISSGLFSSGPWKKKLLTVKGMALSLDDIEHGILREQWRDPRIHYAANCASVGCPDLALKAYKGSRLDAMLDAAARGYINHRRGVRVEGGSLVVSKIFSWYAGDFGNERGVLKHIRRYAGPKLARKLKTVAEISGYEYDWKLNEAAR